MNVLLRDAEQKNPNKGYPDYIEAILEEGFIITCALGPTGALLATGSNNGNIRIWDVETKRCAKLLRGHVAPVTTLSWAQTELVFASGGSDGSVYLWDAHAGTILIAFDLDVLVYHVSLHPTKRQALVDCHESPPVLIDFATKQWRVLKEPLCGQDEWPGGHSASCYHPREELAFIGNITGRVQVLSLDSMSVLRTIDVCERPSLCKSVMLSRAGGVLVVNAERNIYVLDPVTGARFINPLKNRVDKIRWKACAISGDGNWIATGTADKQLHNIYVWDRWTGDLVKTLEGPKSQSVLDLAWHPTLPIIVSVASSGLVYVWAVEREQSWTAYNPKFVELEKNVTYFEREDEFDVHSDEEGEAADGRDQDEEIDVCTVDEGLCYLPYVESFSLASVMEQLHD